MNASGAMTATARSNPGGEGSQGLSAGEVNRVLTRVGRVRMVGQGLGVAVPRLDGYLGAIFAIPFTHAHGRRSWENARVPFLHAIAFISNC